MRIRSYFIYFCLFLIVFFLGGVVQKTVGFDAGLNNNAEFMGLQCGDPAAGLRKCCTLPSDEPTTSVIQSGSGPEADTGFVNVDTNFKTNPISEDELDPAAKEATDKANQAEKDKWIGYSLDTLRSEMAKVPLLDIKSGSEGLVCGIKDNIQDKVVTKDRIEDFIKQMSDDQFKAFHNYMKGRTTVAVPTKNAYILIKGQLDGSDRFIEYYFKQPEIKLDFEKFKAARLRCNDTYHASRARKVGRGVKQLPGKLVDFATNFVKDLFTNAAEWAISWTQSKVNKKLDEKSGSFYAATQSTSNVDYRCKSPAISSKSLSDVGIDPSSILTTETQTKKDQEQWDQSGNGCYCLTPEELDFDKEPVPPAQPQVKNEQKTQFNVLGATDSTVPDVLDKNRGIFDRCVKFQGLGTLFASCILNARPKYLQILGACDKIDPNNKTERNNCSSCILGNQLDDVTSGKSKIGDLEVKGVWTAVGCMPTDLASFIQTKVNGWMIGVAGGFAFGILLYSSYLYMTSRGNPEKLKKAREYLNSALLGLALIIFSVLILQLFGVSILHLPGFTK